MRRLLVAVIVMTMLGCQSPEVYRIEIPAAAHITETVAIQVSQEALRRAGHDPGRSHPERYSNDQNIKEAFCARNETAPDNSYVLWRAEDGLSYSVHMERSDTAMLCRVVRAK